MIEKIYEPDFKAGPYEVYIKWSYISVMGSDESTSDVRVFERTIDGKLVRLAAFAVSHKDNESLPSAGELIVRALVGDR